MTMLCMYYLYTLPLAIKKWSGYNNFNENSVKMHSTEKDPRSTKSPLNNYQSYGTIMHLFNVINEIIIT